MNIEEFRSYCLSKKWVEECTPFGPDTLVFKVADKVFALCGFDNDPFQANLKCDPQWAIELRENYNEVRPGYHMNKQHWNTVIFEGGLTQSLCLQLIDHSYELVYNSLPKKTRIELESYD